MTSVPHPHFANVTADMTRQYVVSDLYELAECQYMPAEMFSYPESEAPMGEESWFENHSLTENGITKMHKYLRTICSNCPVVEDCFAYSLRHEDHLFWGGTTYRERRALRKSYGVEFRPVFDQDSMDEQIIASREAREIIFEEDDYL